MKSRGFAWSTVLIGLAFATFGAMIYSIRLLQEDNEREQHEGSCHEEVTLLATMSGSPNTYRCPNIRHTMKVKPQMVSGTEIGALVICECWSDALERGDRSNVR